MQMAFESITGRKTMNIKRSEFARTGQLRFLKCVQRGAMQTILQEKWERIMGLGDGEPMFEWRDVETVEDAYCRIKDSNLGKRRALPTDPAPEKAPPSNEEMIAFAQHMQTMAKEEAPTLVARKEPTIMSFPVALGLIIQEGRKFQPRKYKRFDTYYFWGDVLDVPCLKNSEGEEVRPNSWLMNAEWIEVER